MNVIIAGAGEVGRHAAEVLGGAGHNVTVIDLSPTVLRSLEDTADLRSLRGNCAQADVILEAGGEHCDLFIAATDGDELNVLSAAVAKAVGAAKCIARVHHSAYFTARGLDYARHFNIDRLICPEHLTARAIARMLRNPGAMAVEDFARGRIEMQQLVVEPGAPAAGVPLTELKLPRGVRLAVIERGAEAFVPDARSAATEGDIVYVFGETAVIEQARRQFQLGKTRRTHVVIMGGTPVGVWLCRAMRSRSFSIRLFETDAQRAEDLARKLDHVTVVRADPTDRAVFDEEQIGSADAFVALTADDEHNILGAAQAKSLGTKRVIAVVQRPAYMHLLEHVGIDRAFSPRWVAAKEIQRLIEDRPVQVLASFAEGTADVYEVRPTVTGQATGQALKSIRMPAHAIIAAIQRGEKVKVPGANDTVLADDTLVVIGPHGADKEIRKLFAGK